MVDFRGPVGEKQGAGPEGVKIVKMVLYYVKVNTHSEKAQRCKKDRNKVL